MVGFMESPVAGNLSRVQKSSALMDCLRQNCLSRRSVLAIVAAPQEDHTEKVWDRIPEYRVNN